MQAMAPINQCFHLGAEAPMVKGGSKYGDVACHHFLDNNRDLILLNASRFGWIVLAFKASQTAVNRFRKQVDSLDFVPQSHHRLFHPTRDSGRIPIGSRTPKNRNCFQTASLLTRLQVSCFLNGINPLRRPCGYPFSAIKAPEFFFCFDKIKKLASGPGGNIKDLTPYIPKICAMVM